MHNINRREEKQRMINSEISKLTAINIERKQVLRQNNGLSDHAKNKAGGKVKLSKVTKLTHE